MKNSFDTLTQLHTPTRSYAIHSLPKFADATGVDLAAMPFVTRILLENLLRHEDGELVTADDILAYARQDAADPATGEVSFHPGRILMPDSSGVPLLADLAAMRDAVAARGLDPRRVNPLIPVDLVIDHSVAVDHAGSPNAMVRNMALEMERNRERYGFVRWAEGQVENLRVVPPGNGILHQINVENLATVVAERVVDGVTWAFPDTLVGMDSHTPMVNGLGVFGWGVGGIEAATAMLGQPVGLLPPTVTGCRLVGSLRPGIMAADIALSLTAWLREADVLGGWVEFFGPGLEALPVTERVSIANMAPEYGATMGFFPVDARTLDFLRATGRPAELVARVEAYTRQQRLFHEPGDHPIYGRAVEFDLSSVEPVMAGPSRPEQRLPLSAVPASFRQALPAGAATSLSDGLTHGDIVIASITSCTNTSNPRQMLAAGLLARNAVARGLRPRDTVKTSLSPGSRAIGSMLEAAGLLEPLAQLGFHITGYGCMSCVGNAGPLPAAVTDAVSARELTVCGVLSSNRNFEGRLHPSVRATYLASPPLIVALALAGSILVDLEHDPLAHDLTGQPVTLRDLWPSDQEIDALAVRVLTPELFAARYAEPSNGGPEWQAMPRGEQPLFNWDSESLSLRQPPFLREDEPRQNAAEDIEGGRILLMLGDDVTTDHISPGGTIPASTAAGRYLTTLGVAEKDYDTYIGRRANHDIMARASFANIRLRNEITPGRAGGVTRHLPDDVEATVFDAAARYRSEATPMVVIAGRNYGCGSSRDWAAKGTRLLGVRAVIAESFERIHRSNLVGMGVLPLQFPPGVTRKTLGLTGTERVDVLGLSSGLRTMMRLHARIHRGDGSQEEIDLTCRVDTLREIEWMRQGGILPYVANKLKASSNQSISRGV